MLAIDPNALPQETGVLHKIGPAIEEEPVEEPEPAAEKEAKPEEPLVCCQRIRY